VIVDLQCHRLPGSRTKRATLAFLCALALFEPPIAAQELRLPNIADSVKFAAFGDTGTGDPPQFQVAEEMLKYHARFPFDRVIMLGDNIYGGQGPKALDRKFTQPYKALLDAGVRFYAALGNHDSQNNRNFAPFNMDGHRYYTYAVKNVRFFVIDSDALDPDQMKWLEDALKSSTNEWKICYFHHPLYSDGRTHGSDISLRVVLEPLFVKYGVKVVFSGHDHIYERITPQKGITYFVDGSGGELRKGDLARSPMTAAGYDQDCVFTLVEIVQSAFHFQAVTRTGVVVDSGTIPRQ
jgi:3',5'-cyclic AMP phosphodiesterase CpdA